MFGYLIFVNIWIELDGLKKQYSSFIKIQTLFQPVETFREYIAVQEKTSNQWKSEPIILMPRDITKSTMTFKVRKCFNDENTNIELFSGHHHRISVG